MNEILNRLNAYYHNLLGALPRITIAILIFVGGILLAGWFSRIFRKKIRAKSEDPLMSNFLSKTIKLVLIIIAFMLALNIAGLSNIAGGLLAAAGASAVVLGFAFKDIAENFLAGIILAFNRPFNVSDTVMIGEVFGKIVSMEFRYTKITTFDGKNVYIPNADVLTKPVYNYTEDNFFRADFVVGIAYENDIDKAKEIIVNIMAAASELVHDDTHINFVAEDELAASTVNLKVFFWINTQDFRRHMLQTRGRLISKVKASLEEAGFNLPANITELKFYKDSGPMKWKEEKE